LKAKKKKRKGKSDHRVGMAGLLDSSRPRDTRL
jgi:hypothetical protein